jgi:hypothetical protein
MREQTFIRKTTEGDEGMRIEDLLKIYQFGTGVGLSTDEGSELLELINSLLCTYGAKAKTNVKTWNAIRALVVRGTKQFEMKVPFSMKLPERYFGEVDPDRPSVRLDPIKGHYLNVKYKMARYFLNIDVKQFIDSRKVVTSVDGDVLLEGFSTGDRFHRFSNHKVVISEKDRALVGDPVHVLLNISFDKAQVSMNNTTQLFPVTFNVLNVKGHESLFTLAGYCPINLPYDDAILFR